ncbi:MAG: hypothetical protein CMM44_06845 [Rhodospirillaceae bacterium]|nr:hypothetical protein [Rhodospirillaceae bacterium]|tara:strand:+ start:13205 stop:14392 length:1188 start_codon:yes stop_codon:yes gene_type:complete
MDFLLSKEQKLLRQISSDFVASITNIDSLQGKFEVDDPKSRSRLKVMAAEGWFSIMVSSRTGGLGLGVTDQTLVMEAAGEGLIMDPIAEIGVAAWAISVGEAATGLGHLLSDLMAGEKLVIPAVYETQIKDFDRKGVVSTNEHHGYQLNGYKSIIPFTITPDYYLVDASTQDGKLIYVIQSEKLDQIFDKKQKTNILNIGILRIPGIFINEDALVSGRKQGSRIASNIHDRLLLANIGKYIGLAQITLNRAREDLIARSGSDDHIEEVDSLQSHLKSIVTLHEKLKLFLYKTCKVIDEGQGNRVMVAEVAAAACKLATHFSEFMAEIQRRLDLKDEQFLMQLLNTATYFPLLYGKLEEHKERAKRLILEEERIKVTKKKHRRQKRRRSVFSKINN